MARPKSSAPRVVFLEVRLKPEIKKAFFEKCKQEKIKPSALIRSWIYDYLGIKKK